jgi:hypothetical protein
MNATQNGHRTLNTLAAADRPASPWAPVVEKVGVPLMWITVGILIDRFVFKKKAA